MRKFNIPSIVFMAAFAVAPLAQANTEPLTREQVAAELQASRASGEYEAMHGEDSGSFWLSARPARSELSRVKVHAEVLAARDRGELGLLHGEDSGSMAMHRHQSDKAQRYADADLAR